MSETPETTPLNTPPGKTLWSEHPKISRSWVYASIAVLAFVIAGFFFWGSKRPTTQILRMTAGDKLGRRYAIAQVLAREAKKQGVFLTFRETTGSAEALTLVSQGLLDAALIQGGIGSQPHVNEVAAIAQEPLHLLVKRELAKSVMTNGLRALRGKHINLSTKGSGTRRVALRVLDFADMKSQRDFTDEDISYTELESRAYVYLPDALFTVSLVPSSVVEYLVRKHGYGIAPVRFARALSLRHPTLQEATIPAYAYGVTPVATPPEDVTTVGTQMLLVVREGVSEDAVKALLNATFAGNFARDATLPELSETHFLSAPEMPIHPGAIAYRDRNDPVITSNLVQGLEDGKSLILSIIVAIYFVYRWWRQRHYGGFDAYLSHVTRIERVALALEAEATPNVHDLMRLRNELGALKTDALEKYTRGQLKSEELMSAFLTHVADVRGYLSALIVAERERIADIARDTLPDEEQTARFQKQWDKQNRQ